MDIKRIIQNKGYNLENGKKVKALFPTKKSSKGEIIGKDIFDEEFARWLELLYPFMIEEYGQEKIDTILYNYTYELIYTNISSFSGFCTQDKVVACWYLKNLHEALTVFLHETGHAAGGPYGNEKLLLAGYEENESFFNKLEEAMVSERQNILEYGEFNTKYYDYMDDNGKIGRNHFKSRSDKYAYYQVFLEGLKILLGESKGLIYENARSSTLEEHDKIYKKIKDEIKSVLKPEQYIILANSLNGAIIHLDYPSKKGDINSKYKKIVIDFKRKNLNEFIETYGYNFSFAKKYGKQNQSIDEDINDFCGLIIEILKQRINDEKYDKLTALSQISRYIVMIKNSDKSLEKATDELMELWRREVSITNEQLTDMSPQEREAISHYILAIPDISYEDLKNIKLLKKQNNNFFIEIGTKGVFYITKGIIEPEKNGKPYCDPCMCVLQMRSTQNLIEIPNRDSEPRDV